MGGEGPGEACNISYPDASPLTRAQSNVPKALRCQLA